MKTTTKFRASIRLCCADTKRIMSPEMSPKSFGTDPWDPKQGIFEIKVIRKLIDSMRSPYSVNFGKRQIIVRPKKIQKRCLRFEDR